MPFTLSLRDFEEARARIAPHIKHTPLLGSRQLSERTGYEARLKAECFQRVGSYKIRGPLNKFALMSEADKRRGVVCSSAGNHAQGVALAAQIHGIRAVVCMAENATPAKVAATRGYGAEVVLHGTIWDEANEKAKELVRDEGLTYVHPFDDEQLIAGQGTLGLEIVQDWPEVDAVVVPIGGGGLISGMAVAAKSLQPSIRIIGVEAALYPSVANAIRGEDAAIGGQTLAEGIAVKAVGRLTLPIIRQLVSEIVLVDEPLIERAVNAYATLSRTMAEGAGATGLAAMLARPDLVRGRRVGLVVSGGNIDARLLASVMVRELEREDRIASFRITTTDRPGLLGAVATRLGALGANILEVSHGRLFLDVPAKGVSVDVTIETRNAEHTADILAALRRDGLEPSRFGPSCLSETTI
jgi:threonine dehydratase